MSTKPANIKDVAHEAKCSIATVSCVLNDRGRIGKATQKRVREACKKLNYFPSAAGRNLRSRKTESIGILFYPSCAHIFRNVFYAEIMEGLEEELTLANQNLLLAGYDISTQQEELPKFIREGNVDGVILMGGCPEEFKQKLSEVNLPFLLLDTDISGVSVDSVTSDGFRAMIDMVSYLHKQGHKHMLMLRHAFDNYNEISRCMGFEAETRRLGLETEVLKVKTNDQATQEIITRINGNDPVTAICTVNDDMAADIMNKLLAVGINVPEQISITGFDDTEFSKKTHPPLTTIRIDRKQMGVEGAKTILRRIGDPNAPLRKLVIPSELITRDSVKQL
ncbi:putative HTH-type transcriptional repressor ExuR [Pontiella desulfatans]|uniref:Putative HTH-type transcriptional repressor ExuR n=1 Tax=Pontiella desulfatans TaxID=2750659 RepID=A0A6C2U714_PONDE|nr:LacI family DNA-binding transcriptional regulator [Pontiella desulfatans]VGO15587.1 putative HTH-type transcriptional repressor ExuR [Pontiella desulfatans]